MWTLKLPPADRSVGPQPRTWGALPAIEHSPGLDWLATTQVTPLPEPAGRLSLTVTPLAVPVPLLLTVTVKPIGSPALTVAASAVLLTWMLAGLQVMLAELLSLPSLVVVTLAVFFFFNDTATTEIYTLSLHDALPIYRSVGPQLRTWG